MEDHELEGLLGAAIPSVTPSAEALVAVLARHRKGRVRVLAVALTVAVVAGPSLGVVIGRASVHGVDRQVLVEAGGDVTTPGAQPTGDTLGVSNVHSRVSAVNGEVVPTSGPSLQRLFLRTVDGVTIRVYKTDFAVSGASTGETGADVTRSCPANAICSPPIPAECRPLSVLQVEMSNDAAVSSSSALLRQLSAQNPVAVVGGGFFGSREGGSVGWVALHIGAGVARVRVRFSDGFADEMAPANGFAVLAHRLATPEPQPTAPAAPPSTSGGAVPPKAFYPPSPPTPQGSVDALDGAGKVTASVVLDGAMDVGSQCQPELPAPVPPTTLPRVALTTVP